MGRLEATKKKEEKKEDTGRTVYEPVADLTLEWPVNARFAR